MTSNKDIQRHLKVKRLRFYLQSTYKKPFHVEHCSEECLKIEWNGLPRTDEVKQCVDDSNSFEDVTRLQLQQHHTNFKREVDRISITSPRIKKTCRHGLGILYDGCRHVLIGVVVFTLHTWFIDR